MPRAHPTVWIVDDLESNLSSFSEAHREHFNVVTFSQPQQVLRRLNSEKPDALLCDIFFYPTSQRAREVEDRVANEAENLRRSAHEIGADDERYLAGIDLIETLDRYYFKRTPFPVYAYTSKGPYLLPRTAWDRIVAAVGMHCE